MLLAYATQAALGFAFSQRLYGIPYEPGRLIRVVAAAVIAALAGLSLPEMRPVISLAARVGVTAATFAALLWISGFLRPTERAFLLNVKERGGG
jgi:hypothetical protein